MNARVLLTVSGEIDAEIDEAVEQGKRPRADYRLLAAALGADVIDYAEADRRAGRAGRLVRRAGGRNALLAWTCFRARTQYDAIVTDGEQIGIPYAALCLAARRRTRPQHAMIVHILSVPKKVMLFKALQLRRRIDRLFVYASRQREFAIDDLNIPPDRVVLTTFMVDTEFFSPDTVTPASRRMICSAGLEFRDYDTLVAAVAGLDVEVVIAAASPWSKRTTDIDTGAPPDNVTVVKLSQFELRQLYADAQFVVMPLVDSDFQAGITAILEAMAMGKAVVCTKTRGQTDTVTDSVNGLYVRPGDVGELRAAVAALLDDPDRAAELGARGRDWVVEHADIEVYSRRLADAVREGLQTP